MDVRPVDSYVAGKSSSDNPAGRLKPEIRDWGRQKLFSGGYAESLRTGLTIKTELNTLQAGLVNNKDQPAI